MQSAHDRSKALENIKMQWMSLPDTAAVPPGGTWVDEVEAYSQSLLGLLKMHLGAMRPKDGQQPEDANALTELDILDGCIQLLLTEVRGNNTVQH